MLSFGPTIEERAALDFCRLVSKVLKQPQGRESSIKIINNLLHNLKKSKGDTRLLIALIKELAHCHPDLMTEIIKSHPDLIPESISVRNYLKDQHQQILVS